MKKALLIFLCCAAGLALLAFFSWTLRADVLAHMVRRHLGVPVSIESLEMTKNSATIKNLFIGNPPHFTSSVAFTARSIDITTPMSKIRANPLIIDEIVMDDLEVTLESQADGTTNWNRILAHHDGSAAKGRHYLIKTIILRNLTVQSIDAKGNRKSYPTLARMEFHNISDETGFPVNEIEKAIFNQMMQDLYQKLNLQKMLQPLIPGGKYIPSGIFDQLFK